jgi:hypothetical protein
VVEHHRALFLSGGAKPGLNALRRFDPAFESGVEERRLRLAQFEVIVVDLIRELEEGQGGTVFRALERPLSHSRLHRALMRGSIERRSENF